MNLWNPSYSVPIVFLLITFETLFQLILTEKVKMLQDEFGADDPGLEDEAIAQKLGIMNVSPSSTGAFRASTA
jgi:hypothetical protein